MYSYDSEVRYNRVKCGQLFSTDFGSLCLHSKLEHMDYMDHADLIDYMEHMD
jgi:hypothetical protein